MEWLFSALLEKDFYTVIDSKKMMINSVLQ